MRRGAGIGSRPAFVSGGIDDDILLRIVAGTFVTGRIARLHNDVATRPQIGDHRIALRCRVGGLGHIHLYS